jgi:hypothetical protein
MADLSPNHSPMPAIRNRITLPKPEAEFPSRSPVPTSRNPQNCSVEPLPSVQRRNEIVSSIQRRFDITPQSTNQQETASGSRNYEELPLESRRLMEATPESRRRTEAGSTLRRQQDPVPRRAQPSPEIRRRTEPLRSRNFPQPSPTAQLLHKLFRNRDPRLLSEPTEASPMTPNNSRRASPRLPELHIEEETVYSEIPSAPTPTEADDDSGSEYLSIDNLSLNLNFDSIRNDSVTPPPAYRTIFDDES